jgi:hypothetical protein
VVGVAEPGGTDDGVDRSSEDLSQQGDLEDGRCRLLREPGGGVLIPVGWDGEHAGRRPVEGGGTVVVASQERCKWLWAQGLGEVRRRL